MLAKQTEFCFLLDVHSVAEDEEYLPPVTNILSHIIINYSKMEGHCFPHFHSMVFIMQLTH